MKPSVLFISEETLKERTVVNNNVDSKFLQQCIWTVQEEQLHPLLGTGLYKRLQEGITATNLTDDEKELLNDYVTNVMLFYVLAELPTVLGFKFYNKNILKQTSENVESASMSDLAYLINHYKSKAEFFSERMKRYVLQKFSEGKFQQYLNQDAKADTILPKRQTYSCGIVLDDYSTTPNIDLGYGEGIKNIL